MQVLASPGRPESRGDMTGGATADFMSMFAVTQTQPVQGADGGGGLFRLAELLRGELD